MIINLVGPFVVNAPFGTEIAFKKGLQQLGHDVRTWDPNCQEPAGHLCAEADATIIFKSCVGRERELWNFMGLNMRHAILYQPDDMRFPHVRQMAVDMKPYCESFLSFDATSALVAETMGYKNCQAMLVTADPEVYYPEEPAVERAIDVCMVASLGDPVAHASRRRIAEIALGLGKRHGWDVQIHDGIPDPEVIRQMYCRSKVVINHATDVGQQFGTGFGLQCRHFEVAATKTAFISNVLIGEQPSHHPPFVLYNNERSFGDWLEECVENKSFRDQFAEEFHDWFRIGHTPKSRAHQLVKYIESLSEKP